MKMPCGKHKGKELKVIEAYYLNWFYDEHKPVILELERVFGIFPREKMSQKVELDVLYDEIRARFPGDAGLKEYHEQVIKRYFTRKK